MSYGERHESSGVVETSFELDVSGRRVPGLLWSSDDDESRPLVMLGHGGTSHKRGDYILAMARLLVRRHGIRAFAIDGPGHGDRLAEGETVNFENAWADEGTSDSVVEDWHQSLDWLRSTQNVTSVGYWGLSMGCMMGVPVVAAVSDVQAAVLGLMGFWGPNSDRIRTDASKLKCPIQFLVQWDDEIVPRDRCFELFGEMGSEEKSMLVHPGLHAAVPPAVMRGSLEFLAVKLGGSSN